MSVYQVGSAYTVIIIVFTMYQSLFRENDWETDTVNVIDQWTCVVTCWRGTWSVSDTDRWFDLLGILSCVRTTTRAVNTPWLSQFAFAPPPPPPLLPTLWLTPTPYHSPYRHNIGSAHWTQGQSLTYFQACVQTVLGFGSPLPPLHPFSLSHPVGMADVTLINL